MDGKQLYARALALGARQPYGPFEQLGEGERVKWDAIAEQAAFLESDAVSRLSRVEQLLQGVIATQRQHTIALDSLTLIGERMSAELDRLTQTVSKNNSMIDSGITLIKGLADEIRTLKAEPAKLSALADSLDAKAAALAAAIAENTPAAPQPIPTPPG